MQPQMFVSLLVLIEAEDEDPIPHRLTLWPRMVELENNSAREADSFRIELGYEDFPFDPRSVRFMQVSIYMAATEPGAAMPMDRTTLRFVGNVDEPETSLAEEGHSVTLRGRDFTSFFLDAAWTGGAIAIDRPLDEVLSEFLQHVPGAGTMPFTFGPGNGEVVLADVLGKDIYTPPQEGDDAWTVLSDLLGLAGLICVVVLDSLNIVTPAQVGTLFQWTGEVEEDLPPLHARMAFGSDIERLRFSRDYNDARHHQIQITCWDPVARESRVVTYPEDGIVVSRRIGVDGKVDVELAPILPFYESGSMSEDQLREKAKRIYEERAREQIEGSFETRSFVDLDGQDLMGLMNGHRITLQIEPNELAGLDRMSASEGVRHLTERGYTESVARALVDAKRRAHRIASQFYVRRAQHRLHHEEGYRLEVEFVNLVGGP